MSADYERIQGHVRAVADAFLTTPDVVLSRNRTPRIANARHVLYWLIRADHYSYPEIGALLERDHTTVLYGVRKVNEDAELLRIACSLVPLKVVA